MNPCEILRNVEYIEAKDEVWHPIEIEICRSNDCVISYQ